MIASQSEIGLITEIAVSGGNKKSAVERPSDQAAEGQRTVTECTSGTG